MNKQNLKKKIWESFILIFTLSIGIFFRLYKIDTVPYGINHDGAWAGLWAIELSQKPWPIQIFSPQGWLGEGMPRYVIAFYIKLFGPTIFSLRLGMLSFTIIALPMFYLLVKELFRNKRIALFSTFLLAVSGWDITYGKSGWAVSSVPVFVITAMYFLVKSIRTGKLLYFSLAGLFTGLTIHTYRAGPPIYLMVTGIFFYHLINHLKEIKKVICNYVAFTIFFILVAGPMIWYAYNNWENYIGRIRFLSVHNKINQQKSISPLWDNFRYAALMYTIQGHFGADFYLKEPLLDFPVSWFFILGLIFSLTQIRKKAFLLLFLLFFTTLIPSLLGNPDGGHAISTIPAVYMFAAIGLESIYILFSKIKIFVSLKLPIIITIPLLFFSAYNTFNLYLGPDRQIRWGFYPETTVVANYMKPRIDKYDIYLTDNYPRDTLTYLTYQDGNPWEKHYTWFEKGTDFLSVPPTLNKGLLFILNKIGYNEPVVQALKHKYPQGSLSELKFKDDSINITAAWIFTVDKPI